jgi:CRP-like cAMP-binding protein
VIVKLTVANLVVVLHLPNANFQILMTKNKKKIELINRMPLVQFIQTHLSISSLKAEEIADRFTEKTVVKDDILFEEGKVCNEYYFLVTGFVRAFTFDTKGEDITTSFYTNNQVVCELFSFFKRVHTQETFRALTDCTAWYITFDKLQVAFHSMPEFREFGRSMLVGSYAELKQRMLSMLHQTAEERYTGLLINSPDIFQYAPLKDIATYLGITRTSLSRIRKDLSKK